MCYNILNIYPLQSPPLVPLDQAIGFSVAMNFSPYPCSSMDLSSETTVSSGIYLLRRGLTHSHSHSEVYLFQHGLICGPQSLEGCICCVVGLSMATDTSRSQIQNTAPYKLLLRKLTVSQLKPVR